jgi:2-(1,2-epoxy-1,2-dihydrophenyl)acetyl-CoA isomerase
MSYDEILFEVRDGAAWVRLNRPDRLNALTSHLAEEFMEVLDTAASDDAIRCLVVTGEGRGFCAGQDLTEFQARGVEALDIAEHLRSGYNRMIRAIVALPKPVIAGVNGVAAGAGLSLALACDVRVASDAASFIQAFVKIGLVPDSGGNWLLPRAVGYGRALEMSISGRKVGSEEGLAIGLVHRVVPSDSFAGELDSVAAEYATAATRAIGATKRLMTSALGMTLEETLEAEAEEQAASAGSADFVEGTLAFLEKRPPSFTGR